MCLFRKLKKQINDLTESNNELSKIIKDEELLKLRAKSKAFDEMQNDINNIKLLVKSARIVENQDTGKLSLKVEYSIPIQYIDFEDDGTLQENKMFKSINRLNLISIEDMTKLSNKIKEKSKWN